MVTDPATGPGGDGGLKVTALECVRGEARLFGPLSFSLAPGQGLFVQGANGAGKSSLLKLLAGLLRPAGGAIEFGGHSIDADLHDYRRHLAYLGHQDGLKPSETAQQALTFLARLRNSPSPLPLAEGLIALSFLNIRSYADTKIRYLSAGQRRRVALAGVLGSNARLWLLDEPTSALDAASSRLVYDALAGHLKTDGMFVVATHDDPPAIAGASTMVLRA